MVALLRRARKLGANRRHAQQPTADRPPIDDVPVQLDAFNDGPHHGMSLMDMMPLGQSILNESTAGPYRMRMSEQIAIDIDHLHDYFRRVYCQLHQSLLDVLGPIEGGGPAAQMDDMLPADTFASLCLMLAKIRIGHINRQMFEFHFVCPVTEITRIELPTCVAAPINAIGCVTMGPLYSMATPYCFGPDTKNRADIILQYRNSLEDNSMAKLHSFVALLKEHGVCKTSVLVMNMGGSLWWLLHNHKSSPVDTDYDANVIEKIFPHFSNMLPSAVVMASLLIPNWNPDD